MDYDFVDNGGKIIFFLHGWGGDKNSFALVKNHTIEKCSMVFVSFTGFGKSPLPSKPYFVIDYVEEVKQLIIKLSKGKKVSIVCHSFGARVASKLCSMYPELVDKLLIVNGAGLKPRHRLRYYFKVWRYKYLKRKVEKGKLNKNELKKYGSSDYKVLSGVMLKTFVQVVNENLENYFKNIQCETLIFWGNKDMATPMYMAKKMNKLIKNSKLYVVKGGGHFSYLDDQDAFIYNLNKFLF